MPNNQPKDKPIKPPVNKQPDHFMPIDPVKYNALTPFDKAALAVKYANPSMSLYQVGKQLVDQGYNGSAKHIYRRWGKGDYFSREFSEITQHNHERIAREVIPLAMDKVMDGLEGKLDIPQTAEFTGAIQVMKAYTDVHSKPSVNVMVNIESASAVQIQALKELKVKASG